MWQFFPSSNEEYSFRKIFEIHNKEFTDLREEFQNKIQAFKENSLNLTEVWFSALLYLIVKDPEQFRIELVARSVCCMNSLRQDFQEFSLL